MEKENRLTFIEFAGKNKWGHKLGLYICSCKDSTRIIRPIKDVKANRLRSCGCIKRERNNNTKHSRCYSYEYRSWQSMKERCYSLNYPGYHYYGGRGVTVCEYWLESFENFYEDMGPRPGKEYTLHRVKDALVYCKENCKWADWEEQGNDRRDCHMLEFNNEVLSISQWARKIGMRPRTLCRRIQSGWSIEDVLTRPLEVHNKKKNKND